MTRRRREHDAWHEYKVAAAAILTLSGIWLLSELTDYDPPEPPAPVQPPQTVEQGYRAEAVRASRGNGRGEIPITLTAPTPDTSGRSEDAGKLTRPVVGHTLACIRQAESGGDYRAFNGLEHYGAYQLSATYSGEWAARYGHGEWAGVTADQWPPSVQDAVAVALFADWPGAWSTLGACT